MRAGGAKGEILTETGRQASCKGLPTGKITWHQKRGRMSRATWGGGAKRRCSAISSSLVNSRGLREVDKGERQNHDLRKAHL